MSFLQEDSKVSVWPEISSRFETNTKQDVLAFFFQKMSNQLHSWVYFLKTGRLTHVLSYPGVLNVVSSLDKLRQEWGKLATGFQHTDKSLWYSRCWISH